MAHFANLDSNNTVVQVFVVSDKNCLDVNGNESEAVGISYLQTNHPNITGTWKQTSYNGKIRKNFAGIGYTYDAGRDAFVPPKPHASWILDEDTCDWEAPTPRPVEEGKQYGWEESNTSWVLITTE